MKTLTQGFAWKHFLHKSQIIGKSLTCVLVSIPWRKKNSLTVYQVELSCVLLDLSNSRTGYMQGEYPKMLTSGLGQVTKD